MVGKRVWILNLLLILILTLVTVGTSYANPGRGTQRPYYSGATVQLPFPMKEVVELGHGNRTDLLKEVLDYFFGAPHTPASFNILVWDLEPSDQTGENFFTFHLTNLGYNVTLTDDPDPDMTPYNLIMVCLGYGTESGTLSLVQQGRLISFNNDGSANTKDGCIYVEGTNFAERQALTTLLNTIFRTLFRDAVDQNIRSLVGIDGSVAENTVVNLSDRVNTDVDDSVPSPASADNINIFMDNIDTVGDAYRTFSRDTYSAGEALEVHIILNPQASATSASISEGIPAEWSASNISDGGTLSGTGGTITWGPFSSGLDRTVTYWAIPPEGQPGIGCFSGTVNFGGAPIDIVGGMCLSQGPYPAPVFTGASRWVPRDSQIYLEYEEADAFVYPLYYHVFRSLLPGAQEFNAGPYAYTSKPHFMMRGQTNGTANHVVVRARDGFGSETINTEEFTCSSETNLIGAAIYNSNFEVDTPPTRVPYVGKPDGWSASGQYAGAKTTQYLIDDTISYDGNQSALMMTMGTPSDPDDLSIASLISDNSFSLTKDHTYAVSAAVKRSDSQWCRFTLFSAGYTLIHTENVDALDDGSGDSGWEIVYFHYRAPINLTNAFLQIDSIVKNTRTAGGFCAMWVDDIHIVDLGIETYTDIYNVTPPPPQYGIRNRYFDLGTETEVSTLGGTVYSSTDMPKRWNISMAVDNENNHDAGYPLWGQETPVGLSDTTGLAAYVKAMAVDTSLPAWPAMAADGVRIDDINNNGQRHVLSFNYGAAGITRPLLRAFMIKPDFSHYSSLFIDPGVGLPGNKMWPLTLHYSPDFGDTVVYVRFDNVTVGAAGSGPHTDETTMYIDNAWLGVVD